MALFLVLTGFFYESSISSGVLHTQREGRGRRYHI